MGCDQLVERDTVMRTFYDPCNYDAKYHVEYTRGTDSKRHSTNVCGVHLRSLKAWEKRMEKINWDCKMVITPILKK